MDVLLGWHFDVTAQPQSLECAARALSVLAPYWEQDLPFTHSLLGDFLEDISKDSRELLNKEKSDEPIVEREEEGNDAVERKRTPREESIHKITSILV